jgi:TP901 family phage tail tape measure protein
MANRIDIPISYSAGSIDQILKDFDAIIKQADISDVFAKDQDKIRAQFANIAATIQQQLGSGNIDLTKINFTGLEKDIEDFARKVAFVLNEAFEKEVEPYAKKITAITDQIVNKQKELADLNQQMADIGGKERDAFKSKYGLSRMPTLDKGEAKRKLAGAEEELDADKGNIDLQKKVEMYRELLEMLSTEKQRKKEIQEQVSKKELEVLTLTNQKKAVQIDLDKAQAKLGIDAANYSQKLLDLNRLLIVAKENGIELSQQQIKLLKDQVEATEKDTAAGKKQEKGLIARAGASFSYGLILGQLRQAFRATLRTVLELDKAMTEAAIVTEMNREEAYKLLGTYQKLARETGLATSEISGIVVEFLKQGRSMAEALELAKVAAMSAKVAGIDAREAVDYLTAAVNGFGLAADKARDIADKFSAIAAASATDFEELAIAMSKVAPVAKTAGVGVDFMMGVLAKGLETTREAPENIGTAFKTIFARMREVTDIGKATEDGMSLNRVEKALASIGVPLRDVTGQFRNLENVLIDVGDKWDTLTSIEQAYIATALAGTRQQPRLLAIFNDFARTKELIQISTDATGQLAFQHMEYMEGAAAALAGLKTAWEGFIMAFTDTNMVVGSIKLITDLLNGITSLFEGIGNSAIRNAALIGLVGMAFVSMAPKYGMNLLLQLQDIAIKEQLKNSTREVQLEYEKLSLAIMKANGAEKERLLTQRKTIIENNKINLGTQALTKSVLASIGATIKAMLVTAAWTLVITIAVAALTAIWNVIKEATMSSDQLADRIQKTNKELNDLSTKEKNVEKLVDRFEQLSRKVVKTSQELDELKNISEELSDIEIGGRKFDITRTDISGNIVLDKNAYEAFLRSVELERKKLLDQNLIDFQNATKKTYTGVIDAFKKRPELIAMAQDIGYDFGINFLNSMSKKGFSQTQVDKAMENLQRAMSRISPTRFLKLSAGQTVPTIIPALTNILQSSKTDTQKTGIRDGVQAIFKELTDIPAASTEELNSRVNDALEKLKNQYGLTAGEVNTLSDQIKYSLLNLSFEFDENKAKDFAKEMSTLFLNAAKMAEAALAKITKPTIKDILEVNLSAYKNALNSINNDKSLSEAEKNIRVNILKESMQDEAIMDMFLEKGMTIDVIVNIVEAGTPLTEISNLVEGIQDKLAAATKTTFIDAGRTAIIEDRFSPEQEAAKLKQYSDALSAAFGKNADYSGAYNLINNIFGKGSADAAIEINNLSKALNLLNVTTAATSLTEQSKNIQDLLKLPEQIAKGDFSKYSDMVAAFGFETVDKLLKGGTSSLTDFFKTNKEDFEKEINKSIKNIEAQFYAINSSNATLGDAEKEQINQLRLMLNYYDQIAGIEQFRASKVKEIKDTIKETNDLYSLQEKLAKGGMSADNAFMKFLDKAIAVSESNSLTNLGNQLKEDIDKLRALGKFMDGKFIRDPNVNIAETEVATKNMMETLTQLIDIQTAAYNREAKAVEERYKLELDAMKQAHDEKWTAIDYNNKLVETEEKLIDARRQLMGLALSGAARGEYKDAQKALEKLQQEREKMIETQMLDEAQKQLEKERNTDLIEAQRLFTSSIEKYTEQLLAIRTADTSPGGAGSGDSGIDRTLIRSDFTLVGLDDSINGLNLNNELLAEQTSDLVEVNSTLIGSLEVLNTTIAGWTGSVDSKTTTTTSTDFVGIL